MAFNVHGQPFDDNKFWKLVEWLQNQKEGAKFSVQGIANDPPGIIAHLKYYIDITQGLEDFVDVEFNESFTMFKIQSKCN